MQSPVRPARCHTVHNGHAYDNDEDYSGSDSEDEETATSVKFCVPSPKDPKHYKAMVYARAVLNARSWQAMA